MLDRVQLKKEAKEIMGGACVSAYKMTLLYLAIVTVLDAVSTYVSGSLVEELHYLAPEIHLPEFLLLPQSFNPVTVLFVTVFASLLASVLNAGLAIYHLGVRRGERMEYSSLFDGFGFVGKVILLNVVIVIFVFAWSLLFYIPGLIAAYRYRFALYNLCENPEMGVLEAINMSKAQTYGHKMDLFVLDLSFLGWNILSVFTLGILNIWLSPYVNQTDLGYFQQIKQMKGIGWMPPQDPQDGEFRRLDPFEGEE